MRLPVRAVHPVHESPDCTRHRWCCMDRSQPLQCQIIFPVHSHICSQVLCSACHTLTDFWLTMRSSCNRDLIAKSSDLISNSSHPLRGFATGSRESVVQCRMQPVPSNIWYRCLHRYRYRYLGILVRACTWYRYLY